MRWESASATMLEDIQWTEAYRSLLSTEVWYIRCAWRSDEDWQLRSQFYFIFCYSLRPSCQTQVINQSITRLCREFDPKSWHYWDWLVSSPNPSQHCRGCPCKVNRLLAIRAAFLESKFGRGIRRWMLVRAERIGLGIGGPVENCGIYMWSF